MRDFDLGAALDRAWREPDSTPALVLKRAEELFAEHGFEGVTVRDLANAAGINVSTLHFHWRDKGTLYEAVHRNLDLHLLHVAQELAAAQERGEDLAAQIDRWVELSMDFMLGRPSAARLFLQYLSRQAPRESPELLAHQQALSETVEAEISRRLPPDLRDRDSLLVMLSTAYFGLVLFCDSPLQRALLGGSVYESAELQARVRAFGASLMQALLSPEPTRSR